MDVINHATGDDFVLFLKELVMPDGQRRPYSMWLSGEYPRVLDGLCKALSLDMRVYDPAWIGMKLRKLLDYSEPLGDFMAFVPGTRKQQTYPSTVAYIARLIIHRYGKLKPGYNIVLVIAASPHRHAAFEAASYLMDFLKTRAPFWKKEIGADGATWVAATEEDEEALTRW